MCWWGRIVCGGDAQCEEVWHDEVVQKEPGVGGGGGELKDVKRRNQESVWSVMPTEPPHNKFVCEHVLYVVCVSWCYVI